MNILILAGGTGSVALQKGIHGVLDETGRQGIEVKVLTNAYDNGLSTGAVRTVLGGQILGPSDVRKNQTLLAELLQSNPDILKFLNIRFTAPSSEADQYCFAELSNMLTYSATGAQVHTAEIQVLRKAIETYFALPAAKTIEYTDFSIANIIYAGIAAENGNSLRAAAKIMADVLKIPDNVILNDDKSLFLGTITESGRHVYDEGDIVQWNNPDDKFVDLFFTDSDGHVETPVLCPEAAKAIADADVIIMSSGTQWSSLLPTYASVGFAEAFNKSTAKKILIMNRSEDADMIGCTSVDLIKNLERFSVNVSDIDVIADSTAVPNMKIKSADVKTFSAYDLAGANPKVHSADKLAQAVLRTIFDLTKTHENWEDHTFIFDFDDTLVGRNNSFSKSSAFNLRKICFFSKNTYICTGNGIDAVHKLQRFLGDASIRVFADGGLNEYLLKSGSHKFIGCTDDEARFSESELVDIIGVLTELEIPRPLIKNRGDVIVSIKPVDPAWRKIVTAHIGSVLKKKLGSGFTVHMAGRTTVEIVRYTDTKRAAIRKILDENRNRSIVYIGDELHDGGNDNVAKEILSEHHGAKIIWVRSPAETALFMKALGVRGDA